MLSSVGTALFAVLASAGTPATTTPATPATSPTDIVVDPLGARNDDSGLDQGWLAPTALTQPPGTFTLQDHELLVVAATWAPIERLQVTVAAAMVFGPIGLLASAKVRVLDLGRFHLALLGAGASDFYQYTTGTYLMGGAAASVCLNANCGALVSAFGMAGPHRTTGSADDGGGVSESKIFFGANAFIPLTRRLKLLVEFDVLSVGKCNSRCESQLFEAIMPMAGVRFHQGPFAVMLGLAYIGEGERSSPPESKTSFSFYPVPVMNLSYRSGGP